MCKMEDMGSINYLFECYDILMGVRESTLNRTEVYRHICLAVNGSINEKRIAMRYIARFIGHFLSEIETAITAHMYLCLDPDDNLRKMAIKKMPQLCDDSPSLIAKVSEALCRLMPLVETPDVVLCERALLRLARKNARLMLSGMFAELKINKEARVPCLEYLQKQMIAKHRWVFTEELEDHFIEGLKSVLQKDVDYEEFKLTMDLLNYTKLARFNNGRLELVEIAMEMASISADNNSFDINIESMTRFILCTKQMLPYFSDTVRTNEWMIFVCAQILPIEKWRILNTIKNYDDIELSILKLLAEMCKFCNKSILTEAQFMILYKLSCEYMPHSSEKFRHLEYSHVECLLRVLHTLATINDNNLPFLENKDIMQDFQDRLQYIARAAQVHINIILKDTNTMREMDSLGIRLGICDSVIILSRKLYNIGKVLKRKVLLTCPALNNKKSKKSH